MYYCPDCGGFFEKALKSYETHGFTSPPFEERYYCPYCEGEDFYEKITTHCRCCGAKLREGLSDYCGEACEKKGKKLWLKDAKRRNLLKHDPISLIIRELNSYNRKNNTNYSYGQYIAYIRPEIKKNEKY